MVAADLHPAVLETFAGLEADEWLAGQGLAEAFAQAFPRMRLGQSAIAAATPTLRGYQTNGIQEETVDNLSVDWHS
eukprot:COSAG02_NODE_22621_length_746_cov_1.125193_2_plen_76_part_00